MGETVVTGLSSDQIHHYADQLATLLVKPLERTGADKYYAPYDVLAKCVNREWQCWAACSEKDKIDCIFITAIIPFPTGYREFSISLVGGSNIDMWLPQAWGLFKDYAKTHQCDAMTGGGRKGWLKVLQSVEAGNFKRKLKFVVEI
ncbi:MAG: hypothetical protein GY746_07460 [Gammaproteobacteria bacterium]|nr:hypothetical protein [Gammaproteobacteria bacterium]